MTSSLHEKIFRVRPLGTNIRYKDPNVPLEKEESPTATALKLLTLCFFLLNKVTSSHAATPNISFLQTLTHQVLFIKHASSRQNQLKNLIHLHAACLLKTLLPLRLSVCRTNIQCWQGRHAPTSKASTASTPKMCRPDIFCCSKALSLCST